MIRPDITNAFWKERNVKGGKAVKSVLIRTCRKAYLRYSYCQNLLSLHVYVLCRRVSQMSS